MSVFFFCIFQVIVFYTSQFLKNNSDFKQRQQDHIMRGELLKK